MLWGVVDLILLAFGLGNGKRTRLVPRLVSGIRYAVTRLGLGPLSASKCALL
jgi:hypothetical protein